LGGYDLLDCFQLAISVLVFVLALSATCILVSRDQLQLRLSQP
jgi:hypothetical protein